MGGTTSRAMHGRGLCSEYNGQPRKFYRLTAKGKAASEAAWANPRLVLYGKTAEKF